MSYEDLEQLLMNDLGEMLAVGVIKEVAKVCWKILRGNFGYDPGTRQDILLSEREKFEKIKSICDEYLMRT